MVGVTRGSLAYLYNKNLIRSMPSEKDFQIRRGSFKSLIGDKKIPQFRNRLRFGSLKTVK